MDAYSKLRPQNDIERCDCASISGLVLVYLFSRNPIHCATCRKEIDPERLGLTSGEVDEIASCFGVYEALYRLWLDSREYEDYAKTKLIDPAGQVNRDGLAIAQKLSQKWPTHYWWFHDTDDGEPTQCPSCSATLDTKIRWGAGKCDHCRVLL